MITTETVWHMHCIIVAMNATIPFVRHWQEWTGLTPDMTESEVKAKSQGNEEKCLAIWKQYTYKFYMIHTQYDNIATIKFEK